MAPNLFAPIASLRYQRSTPAITSSSRIESESKTGPGSADQPQPPSGRLLNSAGRAVGSLNATGILSLPIRLLDALNSFLTCRESLQLIFSSRYLGKAVQECFRRQLRPELAQHCALPIVSVRNTVNLKPSVLGLAPQGEIVYQQCLSIERDMVGERFVLDKTVGKTVDRYATSVIKFFRDLIGERAYADSNDAGWVNADSVEIEHLTLGIALGLGGSLMPDYSRDALLTAILSAYDTTRPDRRPAMISGLCRSFGRHGGRAADFLATLDRILASGASFTSDQMEVMIKALCGGLGGTAMKEDQRRQVVSMILASRASGCLVHIKAMIVGVFLAFGGRAMTPENSDSLMALIWQSHPDDISPDLIYSLTQGIALGLGGPDILPLNRDAVLTRIIASSGSWDKTNMGVAIVTFCCALGGAQISAEHRDAILVKIVTSSGTCTPDQTAAMIVMVCRGLNGGKAGAREISNEHLGVVTDAILNGRASCSPIQLSAMFCGLYRVLGSEQMVPWHRDLLVARIVQSAHADEIVAAIKLYRIGRDMVAYLLPGGFPTHRMANSSSSSSVEGYQSGSIRQSQPPSGPVSRTTGRTVGSLSSTCILSMPTRLLQSVNSYLTHRESLQLMSSHPYLGRELQALDSKQPRPEVTKKSEMAYQRCLSIKSEMERQRVASAGPGGKTEDHYLAAVIDLFKELMSEASCAEPDDAEWVNAESLEIEQLTLGIALGLGGSLMPAQSRDALLATILSADELTRPDQRHAMILGLCKSFGREGGRAEHFQATLDRILAFGTSFRPNRMGVMIKALCEGLGGAAMVDDQRHQVVSTILESDESDFKNYIEAMVVSVFSAFGGRDMTPESRDRLMEQIWQSYRDDMSLNFFSRIMQGMALGLGGPYMLPLHRDAVLTRMMGSSGSWSTDYMGAAILSLCYALGGAQISAQNRDAMLAKIANSSGPCTPNQMGGLIFMMCRGLNDGNFGAQHIANDHLGAVISAILNGRTSCSPRQLSYMFCGVYRALGSEHIAPGHRHILMARILQSGHADEIVAAIKLEKIGRAMLADLLPG